MEYVNPSGEFDRDQRYISTRITADGRDGYPVEPGRYRLIVARACPWANRSIIVRRLKRLEAIRDVERRIEKAEGQQQDLPNVSVSKLLSPNEAQLDKRFNVFAPCAGCAWTVIPGREGHIFLIVNSHQALVE